MSLLTLEIQGHTLLAAVPAQVHEAESSLVRPADHSHVVPVGRLLDLDHLGTQVCQVHADGIRSEKCQLENANAAEKVVDDRSSRFRRLMADDLLSHSVVVLTNRQSALYAEEEADRYQRRHPWRGDLAAEQYTLRVELPSP